MSEEDISSIEILLDALELPVTGLPYTVATARAASKLADAIRFMCSSLPFYLACGHYTKSAADAPRSAFASFAVRLDKRIKIDSLTARLHLQLQDDVAVFINRYAVKLQETTQPRVQIRDSHSASAAHLSLLRPATGL